MATVGHNSRKRREAAKQLPVAVVDPKSFTDDDRKALTDAIELIYADGTISEQEKFAMMLQLCIQPGNGGV